MGDGKPPKEVSVTDPLATWVARPVVDPFFASDANHLIDNKAGSSSTPRARANRMETILRLDRLRLRGLSGVRDEVLLTAIVQNLRRHVPRPPRRKNGVLQHNPLPKKRT